MGPWPTRYEPARTNIQKPMEDIVQGLAQWIGDPLYVILDILELRSVHRNLGLTLIPDLLQ
jgi:hypothetical protein